MKINTVTLFGHLGSDPEEKDGNAGPYVKCRLGVNQGRGKESMWLGIVAFGWARMAREDLMKCAKGDGVTVTGALESREYDGKEYFSVVCSTVMANGPSTHDIGASERQYRKAPSPGSGTPSPDNDDDIPF